MYEAFMNQLVQERLAVHLVDGTRKTHSVLREINLSQESCACDHKALEEDADLNRLIANLFGHVEGSDKGKYWKDLLSMTDALMQNVYAVHICNWDEFVSFFVCAMLP